MSRAYRRYGKIDRVPTWVSAGLRDARQNERRTQRKSTCNNPAITRYSPTAAGTGPIYRTFIFHSMRFKSDV